MEQPTSLTPSRDGENCYLKVGITTCRRGRHHARFFCHAALNTLVLGGPMVYRNLTHLERLYFKMYKYDFVKTWHGAYHANPDYTHWYGWAELNLDFSDIASAAYDIRRYYALQMCLENNLASVWTVPYQGVYWSTGSMNEVYDLFPAGTDMSVDANGSGSPTVYRGLTFH